MIFSISPTATTLYDEIRYTGAPQEFAWVLPIQGTVTVGLSADVLFGTLDALTQTGVQAPPTGCPASRCATFGRSGGLPSNASAGGTSESSDAASAQAGPPPVTVLKQDVVGPYETVQLRSTDPNALDTWLSAHGYTVSPDEQPIIAAYVGAQFNFLAMKLVPGANVQAMRPVRVSTPGAGLSLPLRMVAAGTGATVGITLWVVSQGRYEPQNFPFFHIEDSELVWDWPSMSSNYTTVRQQKEQALGNAGWEIESSLDLQTTQVQSFVLSGGNQYGGTAPASADYLAVPASDAGAGQTAEQVRQEDLAALFGSTGQFGQARVTRIRSDLAHTALAQDLQLTASQAQSTLPNLRNPTQESGEPLCPVYDFNCNQVGQVPRSQALNPPSGSGTFSCNAASAEGDLPFALGGVGLALFGVSVAVSRRRRA
jgi:hypothetical protein